MPRFEITTQLNVVTHINAASAEEAQATAEHFVGSWMEPTYTDLQDYAEDCRDIDAVQDWDVVQSIVEEVE